jgi:hypothetical protein
MGERAGSLTIAVSLTVLDVVVAARYGAVIWRVWAEILWIRIGVLLLAYVWAGSLVRIWAQACCEMRKAIWQRGVEA